MLEHPDITRTLRKGYPKPEPKIYGVDPLGNAVLYGDEILEVDDIYFAVDGLDSTAKLVLEELGANYKIAKK